MNIKKAMGIWNSGLSKEEAVKKNYQRVIKNGKGFLDRGSN